MMQASDHTTCDIIFIKIPPCPHAAVKPAGIMRITWHAIVVITEIIRE